MSYFLREVYSNIKWDKTQFPSWLKEGELPSCIIRDLRADDNAISLWEINDDKSNLPDVIAALVVAKRKKFKNDFDYALLDENLLNQPSFKPRKITGKTPYHVANSYHCDVPKLPISSVVYFAHLLRRYGKFDRMGWKDIETQLKDAHKRSQLDVSTLESDLKQQLDISE